MSLCVANLASMIIANKVNYEHLPKSICDYDALIVRCVEAINGCLASEQVADELAMLKHEVRCFGGKAELSRYTRNLLSELFNGR